MDAQRRWYPADWMRLGFLLVFAVFAAAMIYARFTMAPAMNGGAHFGWWFPFGGFWLLLAAFLFFGPMRWALWGPRWRRGGFGGGDGHGGRHRQDVAYHILRERFARGEITKDQYDAMMRTLGEPRNGV